MQIYLCETNKKPNSTAIPFAGLYTDVSLNNISVVSGSLKTPSGIVNPVVGFVFDNADTNPVTKLWNYAWVPDYHRYYHIKDWEFDAGIWYGYMQVDALASFRRDIGRYQQYITRSAKSDYWDLSVNDVMYPITGESSWSQDTATNPFTLHDIPSEGTFIIGILSDPSGNTDCGAITYWALTDTQFNDLADWLFGDTVYNGISSSEISSDLVKLLYNPMQYIATSFFLPLPISSVYESSTVHDIKYGWWSTGTSGYWCKRSLLYENTVTLSVPYHPQCANERASYLNLSPYASYTLYYEPFGIIPLAPELLGRHNTITVQTSVSLTTGDAIVRISSGLENIAVNYYNIAVPVQLTQTTTDIIGAGQAALSGISTATGQMLKLNIVGAIATAASAIGDMAVSSAPIAATYGTFGGFNMISDAIRLQAIFYRVVTPDPYKFGKPCCIRTIPQLSGRSDTCSGYMVIADAVPILNGATSEETSIVKQAMESGFYWE